jgi:UDP-N-acetylglucosamine 2-epimerase (hydrolysing)
MWRGGEISGTTDDSYRHAISKLAHVHFVSNQDALNRLLQLGEDPASVHVIGSPELDLMNSQELPPPAFGEGKVPDSL